MENSNPSDFGEEPEIELDQTIITYCSEPPIFKYKDLKDSPKYVCKKHIIVIVESYNYAKITLAFEHLLEDDLFDEGIKCKCLVKKSNIVLKMDSLESTESEDINKNGQLK